MSGFMSSRFLDPSRRELTAQKGSASLRGERNLSRPYQYDATPPGLDLQHRSVAPHRADVSVDMSPPPSQSDRLLSVSPGGYFTVKSNGSARTAPSQRKNRQHSEGIHSEARRVVSFEMSPIHDDDDRSATPSERGNAALQQEPSLVRASFQTPPQTLASVSSPTSVLSHLTGGRVVPQRAVELSVDAPVLSRSPPLANEFTTKLAQGNQIRRTATSPHREQQMSTLLDDMLATPPQLTEIGVASVEPGRDVVLRWACIYCALCDELVLPAAHSQVTFCPQCGKRQPVAL